MGVYLTWLIRSNTATDGSPIITKVKMAALHQAVRAACDSLDGLVDGQIDDPRTCRSDPEKVQCPTGTDTPTCLTPTQVAAARKLYDGPRDADGRLLYPGGLPRGSELAWDGVITPDPYLGRPLARFIADGYLRYLGYPIGRPHSSVEDFEFTVREFHRLTPEGLKGNALSLDLERFYRSGGKLILWHGSSDPVVPFLGTLDYYQRLWERNGGLRNTQKWARLFVVPSMFHCHGGEQLTEFDPLPALVRWVERGDAPDKIVANGLNAQGDVLRTRPVFPYPLRARYDGGGSIDDARNFVPASPAEPLHDKIPWVGSYLYNLPGPVA
jgi:Tannase and feruloyl esterase